MFNTFPVPPDPRIDDEAFQPPRDLAANPDEVRARAQIINREIPNLNVQIGWAISDVRGALTDLVMGLFDRPSQLLDAIASDSRVQSAMRSRSGGLLGRPVRFEPPAHLQHDPIAIKCCRAWQRHWPQMSAEAALLDMTETAGSLGHAYAQILWDTSGKNWLPYLQTFHSRYSYFRWIDRKHIAITLDGQYPITPGDGHWVLHAPYGYYRGWMRGALRALAQWWLARNYGLRDWARYCERHGFPILLADTPFGADPTDVLAYTSQLATIGQESVLQLPGGPDVTKYGKYDLRYLEPADANWQAFQALINQCNDEITLALLGQNLTTQVKEGSFAAARVHADVRQSILEADARALAKTIYTQVARPFAALNYGDAKYAPLIKWDVRAEEDFKTKASTFQSYALAMQNMRLAGYHISNPEGFARKFGLFGMKVEIKPPVQIEAQLARATGKDNEAEAAAAAVDDKQEASQDDKKDG